MRRERLDDDDDVDGEAGHVRLEPGDLVTVVAPSGPVDADALRRGVAVLEGWGLRVRVAPCAGGHCDPVLGYLAGPDTARAADFGEAWADPEVRGVLCARGGYGAQRIIDLIDWGRVRAAGPKVFVGSSDITALHAAVARRLDQVTLFGPMPAGTALSSDPATAEALRRALFEGLETVSAPDGEALVPGTAEGVLHGGTVTLLATSLDAFEGDPPHGDRIVFLEDIGEAVYRLDRFLTQMLRAGWFDGVAGIVFGSFIDCGAEAELRAMLLDRLGPLDVPMLWGLPAGHGPTQLTLPFGAPAELSADDAVLRFPD
ncbi:S66 peptidase family protein [Thermomonospora umbrina]|uniref:Muramoyltetrapeptide carboxypeptidase n=1 Tax=Thermomonospora umbrina TaxID=111806 RepID=A0A3D9SHI5_9ACTN|nr:LD-carboxypeptidase [Thermomonospora umbrina]REE95378.1 muramoyltetrapeptide carboxypeptidase [Thermomonospora umbrina]